MTLAEMIEAGHASAEDLREKVGAMAPAARATECLSLSASQQKRLWQLASTEPTAPGLLLPPDARSSTFGGRNSLRMFTRFEKHFARHEGGIVGYNRHPLSWLIGPGYFTVEPDPIGGLRFDYEQVPRDSPPGWPAVAPNSRTFARPVYGQLSDRVAWVSRDVLIGSAYRFERPLDSYFVLARLPG